MTEDQIESTAQALREKLAIDRSKQSRLWCRAEVLALLTLREAVEAAMKDAQVFTLVPAGDREAVDRPT